MNPKFSLSWSSDWATSYEYEIARDTGFSDVVGLGTATDEGLVFTADQPGTYFYRAKACNDRGCSAWSEAESFCLDAGPGTVQITNT